VRSCSASLAPVILDRLEAAFGAPVLEAYAMTEASHMMTSNPLPQDGPRKPGSVGRAAGAMEVAVLDEAGGQAPAGERGEVCIRGANVTAGYKTADPGANEAAFLRRVAKAMEVLRPNSIHQRLTRLAVSDILTTNYDDCLERSLARTASVADFGTGETKHNLFRRSRIGRQHFWHVHGDIFRPNSVLLGHDRYVDSAAQIRRYCDRSLGISFKAHPTPLRAWHLQPDRRLDPRQPHSWVDLLLRREVHIVGFGLDYTEVDLWYLLSLRHRLRTHERTPWRPGARVLFHHFDEHHPALQQKRELLSGFGVETVAHPLPEADYARGWNQLLTQLEQRIGTRGATRS
jgi:acyl-CoA synthetase (AMP-forming)/AMP-acid ligase II